MSSVGPIIPPYFNGVIYNPNQYQSGSTPITLSYANVHYLQRVGNPISVATTTTFSGTTNATSATTGTVIISGGLGITKDIFTSGSILTTTTTLSLTNSNRITMQTGDLVLIGNAIGGAYVDNAVLVGTRLSVGIASVGNYNIMYGSTICNTPGSALGASNVFIGTQICAGGVAQNGCARNVIIGQSSNVNIVNGTAATLTSGTDNTIIGTASSTGLGTGSNNTVIGSGSGGNLSSASNCGAFGVNAGGASSAVTLATTDNVYVYGNNSVISHNLSLAATGAINVSPGCTTLNFLNTNTCSVGFNMLGSVTGKVMIGLAATPANAGDVDFYSNIGATNMLRMGSYNATAGGTTTGTNIRGSNVFIADGGSTTIVRIQTAVSATGNMINMGHITNTSTIGINTVQLNLNSPTIDNTTATSSLFATPTTINFAAGASVAYTIGNASATAIIQATTLNLNAATIDNTAATLSLFATPTNITLGATVTGTLTLGNTSGTITNSFTTLNLNGATISSNAATLGLFASVATLNIGASSTTVSIGSSATTCNFGTGPAKIQVVSATLTLGTNPTNVNIATSGTNVTIGNTGGVSTVVINGITTSIQVAPLGAATVSIGDATSNVRTSSISLNTGVVKCNNTSITTVSLWDTNATTLTIGNAATSLSIGKPFSNTTSQSITTAPGSLNTSRAPLQLPNLFSGNWGTNGSASVPIYGAGYQTFSVIPGGTSGNSSLPIYMYKIGNMVTLTITGDNWANGTLGVTTFNLSAYPEIYSQTALTQNLYGLNNSVSGPLLAQLSVTGSLTIGPVASGIQTTYLNSGTSSFPSFCFSYMCKTTSGGY